MERHRRWVEVKLGSRLNGDQTSRIYAKKTPTKALTEFTLRDLWEGECNAPSDLEAFNPGSSGCFDRTIALIHLLDAGENTQGVNGEQLLELLDKTIDVAYLVSAEEISSFLNGGQEDKIYNYLRAAILQDCKNTSISSHRLRKSIEDVVLAKFGGNIVEFSDYIYSRGKHVGDHLFYTCTESFLVQLYRLLHSSIEVVEAQAALLEWYAVKADTPNLLDRAKSLRLETKLSKVRGDIDDNRIYVDALRLHQWITDNISTDLRSAIPYLADWPQTVPAASEISNPVSLIQHPEYRVGSLLNKAYAEFCSNKFFGVDSYIGRRIRHGTLHGTMVPDIKGIVDDFCASYSASEPQACQRLVAWLFIYEASIRRIGEEILQIKSESKGKGWLEPTITGGPKHSAAKLSIELISKELASETSIPTVLSLMIEAFWLIIEVDLKKIRSELQRMRESDLLIDVASFISSCGTKDIAALAEVCRALNETVQRKFSTLSLWLGRPANVSPSATLGLLFNAVLFEVKEQIPDYNPTVKETGLVDLDLYGHRYHYVYDILYVIVHNAASHGASRGPLKFSAERIVERDGDGVATFVVALESQFSEDTDVADVKEKIDLAMSADLEDAMVTEGFSGLRKVRSIAKQLDEITAFSVSYSANDVRFEFELTFPVT